MKDVISALSGLITLIVFIICIINDVGFEATLIRVVICFFATNIIGHIAMTLSIITMYKKEEVETQTQIHTDDNAKKATSNA